MVKRLCPFDDFQPQMKIHVNDFDQLDPQDVTMTKVYEKTRNILFSANAQPSQGQVIESVNHTKVSSQPQSKMGPNNLCQGCKSINFLPPNQCWFCESSFCNSCVSPCCLCYQVFCRDCSTIRYDQNSDTTICLSCSSAQQ